MMSNFYTFLALDLANERVREAENRARFLRFDGELPDAAPGLARRSLARAAATVSRGSAALARRLDDRFADTEARDGDRLPA